MPVLKSVLCVFGFISILLSTSDADNILCVSPSPSLSHHVVMRTMTRELLKRGHRMFVITVHPIFTNGQTSPNLTEILLHKESLGLYSSDRLTANNNDIVSQLDVGLEIIFNIFSSQFKSKTFQQIINNKSHKFDLLIVHAPFFPSWLFSHFYKIPVIGFSTSSLLPIYFKPLGHSEHIKYYPDFLGKYKSEMSYLQTVSTISEHVSIHNIFNYYEQKCDNILREESQTSLPSLSVLYNNVHTMLVNSNYIWEGIRPISQNVFSLGALQCKAGGELVESHHPVIRTMTQELLKRGHRMFVITIHPIFTNGQTSPNLTEILLYKESLGLYSKDHLTDNNNDIVSQLDAGLEIVFNVFSSQFKSKTFQQIINNKSHKFDLLIVNVAFFPTWILSHLYKIPVIGFSTSSLLPIYFKPLGHSEHIKYYPDFLRKYKSEMSYLQTVNTISEHVSIHNIFNYYEQKCDNIFREESQTSFPSLSALYNNVHTMLVNSNYIWEGIRPISQNVFNLGALQCKTGGELVEDLQAYLDSSKHGVIYMSFGTSVVPSTLPTDTINKFMKAFSQLPYDVLWKWDKEEMPGKPDNVRLFKWLPQADILKHPKIKLFITQAGQHSSDEAIDAGVPLIGIPILFDQFGHAERYVRFGIGKHLNINTVTSEEFKQAIETVIREESYRQNIKQLRALLLDKPMTSMDKAMWAVEYVLRHGGAKHLRSPSANLSWAEYYEFELLFTFLAACLFVICLLVKCLLLIMRFASRLISRSGNREVKFEKIM